jgi:hypothetical protein
MRGLRTLSASILSVSLATIPVCAGTNSTAIPLGIVLTADHARVGESPVSVGTTVYGGDLLSTEADGNLQVRAGAARLLLVGSTTAVLNDNEGIHSAKLIRGTAVFSTGNAHAFTLFASKAAFSAHTDAPTIGQVTYVSDKELLVLAKRGDLLVTVEGESQVIPEGTSYRVLLDPPAGEPGQGPAGAGGGPPAVAGRSHFLVMATIVVAVGTTFAIIAACESPFSL